VQSLDGHRLPGLYRVVILSGIHPMKGQSGRHEGTIASGLGFLQQLYRQDDTSGRAD